MDKNLLFKYRTLGIITLVVVLSFSILAFFLNLREKKTVSFKTKTFFSDMSQNIQYSTTNHGKPADWGWVKGSDNIEIIRDNIVSSLKLSKNCLFHSGSCFHKDCYKNLNGQNVELSKEYMPSVIMQNGISIAFQSIGDCRNSNEVCLLMYVDVNALDKPNVLGRDLFVFELVNSYNLYFRPHGIAFPSKISGDSVYSCSKSAKLPMYCSALLFINNWVINKTYPW